MKSGAFQFNTRKHVKIWLGPINLENKLRLMNLRALNPDSVLHLIYDRRLLTRHQLRTLHDICNKHRIIPFDVVTQIFPECTTPEEQNLILAYEEAIAEPQIGANLAAASDILRWLAPIIKLGTYSDLDVLINTHHVPPIVEVDRPLLLNIGSLDFFVMESMSINNDIVAIANLDAAMPLIKNMQRSIYEGCKSYPAHESAFSRYRHLFQILMPAFNPMPYADLDAIARGKSIVNARQEILRITANNTNLCDYYYYSAICWLSTDSFLTQIRTVTRLILMKESVIYTSGPIVPGFALFSGFTFSRNQFSVNVLPFALGHYGLGSVFPSKNGVPLRANGWLYQRDMVQRNDLSWLEYGKLLINQRELEIIQKAAPFRYMNLSYVYTMLFEEMTDITREHAQQIEVAKHQFEVSEVCSNREVVFSTCTETQGQSVCIHTRVYFTLTPSTQFLKLPEPTEYYCRPFVDGRAGRECVGERTENICAPPDPEPSLTNTLWSAARHGAVMTVLPEAIDDALRLSGYGSFAQTYQIKTATRVLLIVLNGSWLANRVGAGVSLMLGMAGYASSHANVIGNAVACAINFGRNVTLTGIASAGAGYLAGKLGLWAEKRVVKKLEAEPSYPKLAR